MGVPVIASDINDFRELAELEEKAPAFVAANDGQSHVFNDGGN